MINNQPQDAQWPSIDPPKPSMTEKKRFWIILAISVFVIFGFIGLGAALNNQSSPVVSSNSAATQTSTSSLIDDMHSALYVVVNTYLENGTDQEVEGAIAEYEAAVSAAKPFISTFDSARDRSTQMQGGKLRAMLGVGNGIISGITAGIHDNVSMHTTTKNLWDNYSDYYMDYLVATS